MSITCVPCDASPLIVEVVVNAVLFDHIVMDEPRLIDGVVDRIVGQLEPMEILVAARVHRRCPSAVGSVRDPSQRYRMRDVVVPGTRKFLCASAQPSSMMPTMMPLPSTVALLTCLSAGRSMSRNESSRHGCSGLGTLIRLMPGLLTIAASLFRNEVA